MAHSTQRSEQWLKAPPEADQPQAEVGSTQQSRGRMSACFLPPVLLPTPIAQSSSLSTD